jgi:putative phage-type endonuclease
MLDIVQGTDDWHQLRLGKVTASRLPDVISKTKSGWAASRANYMAELIAERLTSIPTSSYFNAAMQWGTETEPTARTAYAFFRGTPVHEVGFVQHPDIEMAGASPDGLVDENGMVEFKCPNTATHIDTLTKRKIPARYITQMQWQMACACREWNDFVSFDPRMPEDLKMFVKRIPRDDERIRELEALVRQFLDEIADKIMQLREAAS